MSTPNSVINLTDTVSATMPPAAANGDPLRQPTGLARGRSDGAAAPVDLAPVERQALPFPKAADPSVPRPGHRTRLAPVEAIGPLLAIADALILIFGFGGLALLQWDQLQSFVLIGMIGTLVFVQFSRLLGTRRIWRPRHHRNMVARTAVCIGVVMLALEVSILLLDLHQAVRLQDWLWLLGMALAVLATRLVAGRVVSRWRAQGKTVQHVAVIGANKIAAETITAIEADDEHEMTMVGVFDDRIQARSKDRSSLRRRGTVKDLFELMRRERIDVIIIALPWSAERRILEILQQLRNVPAEVVLAPQLDMVLQPGIGHRARGLRLVEVQSQPLARGNRILKEVVERMLALAMLIGALPLLTLIALAIKLESRGPVLFRQDRRGLGGTIIRVLKFRTMYHDRADPGAARQTEKDDPRVTGIGAFLRKTSLDELPQLINVLNGQMSLVGPRPYALEMRVDDHMVRDILQEYLLRHHVKPGITGWAQVNGSHGPVHSMTELIERTELDVYYIRNWSLALDLQILLQTARLVLTGRSNA